MTFGFWGVNVSGTAVFSTVDQMTQTLKGLVAQDFSIQNQALKAIGQNLVPSINLTFYF